MIWKSTQLNQYSDRLRAGRLGFEFRQGKYFFLLHKIPTVSGAHTAPNPTVSYSSEITPLGHEADYSHLSTTEVKSFGAMPPLPSMT
jgi:hypothetical protein